MATAQSYHSVDPRLRFTRKTQACPICHGDQDDRRGRGVCCIGYLSTDERYAFCTREEYAGDLQPRQTATGPAWKHRLDGPCWCNGSHETTQPRPAPARQPEREVTAPKVYTTIPDRLPGAEAYRKTATYDYRDAGGTLLYIIARYEGCNAEGKRDKEIRPFRPVDGGWVSRRAEASLLYRLPELLTADPWAPVYLCEGEKDADRLAAGGLIATTNAFGAGSWDMVGDAPEHLAGRHVVIVEHNDQDGRKRTITVAASLEATAASVRVMRFTDLPEHGDVSDWLDAGHTIDELHRQCATLPIIARMPESQNSNPAMQDDTPTETQITCAGCVRLTKQLRIAEDARKIAETSLFNLRKEQAMTKRILAMPKEQLSPTLKPAAIAVRNVLGQTHARDDEGMEQVYRREIAQQCGVSDQTASTYLRDLAKAGIIRREVTKTFDRSEIRIAEGPLFDEPEKVEVQPMAKTWGGRRVKTCYACGSENLETRVVCRECGTVQSAEDTNKPEPQDDADMSSAQNSNPAMQDDTPVYETLEGLFAQTDAQDHSLPQDISIVTDLASHTQDSCPDCGGPTHPSPVGPLCRSCVKLLPRAVAS